MSIRKPFLGQTESHTSATQMPRWWRWSCIVVGTLVLCSCQAPQSWLKSSADELPPMASAAYAGDGVGQMAPPQQQMMPPMGAPGMPGMGAPQMGMGVPPMGMGGPSMSGPGQGGTHPLDMISKYGMRPTHVPAGVESNPSGVVPVGYMESMESAPQDGNLVADDTQGLPYDPTVGYTPSMYAPMYPGVPLPQDVYSNWSPPGIARPWPEIEYLRDGGDRYSPVSVDPNWNVSGLETEDTIAHYDTADGLVHVEPSNRVHIYAPRFASVRSVTSAALDDQIVRMDRFRSEQQLVGLEKNELAAAHLQREQVITDIGSRHVEGFKRLQFEDIYSRAQLADQFSDRFLPFEDLAIIRQGIHQQTEQLKLAAGMDAAVTWAHDTAVQVVLDSVNAVVTENVQSAEVVYTVNAGPGPAKLRIVKVASTNYAKPGEVIDFTLRFDNVGAQVIGNVTIIDNLTTRLEYVEGSAQSSLPGEFFTDPNEGDSLRLRWEITDPLKVSEGGVIRFQCRVR